MRKKGTRGASSLARPDRQKVGRAIKRYSAGATKGLDRDRLAKWDQLLHDESISPRAFLETFLTRTKDPQTGKTRVEPVRFRLFPFQVQLHDDTLAIWETGRAARWRIPKSRQRGVSQFWRAFLGFERVLRVPGYETMILAQHSPASREHLSYLTEFHDQVPQKYLRACGVHRISGTRTEFIYRHGNFLRSRVEVMTSKRSGLGRGGQANGILTTERPSWEKKANVDLSSFMESWADVAGNVHADESTCMGLDDFYDDCMAARDGRGSYRLLFLPSHGADRNYRAFESDGHMQTFAATLGRDERYGGIEEHEVLGRVERYWLSERGVEKDEAETKALEFVHWRRFKIDDDCKRIAVLHREQPTTLEEAFQGSGRHALDVEIVQSWTDAARRREIAGENGALLLKEKRILFAPRGDSALRVFERPRPGAYYCWGADVASGHRVIASDGGEADWSVAIVKEVYSGRTVARFRDHIFEKPFADFLHQLAVWYNGAQGYVEINRPAVVLFMVEDETDVLGYLGTDVLLTSERKVKTTDGYEMQKQYGWNTSGGAGGSRNYMIGCLNKFLSEIGRNTDGTRESYLDFHTLEEMMRFCYNDQGKAEAEKGFDDCVFAEGMALVARDEMLHMVPRSSPVEQETDPWAEYFEGQAKERRQRARNRGRTLVPHPQRRGEFIEITPGRRMR